MNNDVLFETGLQEINFGKVKVMFNPADLNLATRAANMLFEIQDICEKYQGEIDALDAGNREDAIKAESIGHNADLEIREKINSLFDTDVCTPNIGNCSITAPAGGLPIWQNMLLALLESFEAKVVEEQRKTNPRLEAYIKKYKRNR